MYYRTPNVYLCAPRTHAGVLCGIFAGGLMAATVATLHAQPLVALGLLVAAARKPHSRCARPAICMHAPLASVVSVLNAWRDGIFEKKPKAVVADGEGEGSEKLEHEDGVDDKGKEDQKVTLHSTAAVQNLTYKNTACCQEVIENGGEKAGSAMKSRHSAGANGVTSRPRD